MRVEIAAHGRGDFCYTMRVHLKVKEPKKLSRGTIGNDADLLAGNLRWSQGDEGVNPRGQRARRSRANSTGGKVTAWDYCLKTVTECPEVKMKHQENEPYGEILVLAQALNGLYEQSCTMLKPVVDDCCRHPDSVDEKELEHIFDMVLDVSCCSKGKRLFNRLCKSFGRIYPDCVKDYIGFDREMWGDETNE